MVHRDFITWLETLLGCLHLHAIGPRVGTFD